MNPKRILSAVLATAVCSSPALVVPSAEASSTRTTTAATSSSTTTTPPFEMPAGGVFSAGTAWKLDVRNAPLHPNSAGMVRNVAEQTAKYYGGTAAFNAYQYSTSFYTVGPDQPRVDVKWNNCQGKNYTPAGLLGEAGQFSQVPIPADAVPAKGTDSQLTIYSPSTDQLWEFWVTAKSGGTWSACWGGRIDDVSQSDGYFPGTFGASASGLALAGGTVGIRDVESGSIDHAIALHLPSPGKWDEFSYPAQRSDGFDTSADRVPEGTRLRLDPSVDVDSLRLTPIAKMIAKAAQKYGFVVTDKAGCTAVIGESPAAAIAATGVDPWKALMAGTPDYAVMKDFPWSSLQAIAKDHGKPAVPGSATAPAGTTLRYVSDSPFRTVRNGWGPVEKDRTNGEIAAGDGRTLTVASVVHPKGLGVHAPSEVVVPVDGASTFQTKVGVDDEAGKNGSVVFQVWNGSTKLADSGTVTAGQAARPLTVDVRGASELRLVVTDSGNGNAGDHADWLDSRFLTPVGGTTTPAPTATPTPTPTPTPTATTTNASDTAYRVVRNGWGPAEADRSNGELGAADGRPMTVAGQAFDKGFGVHAASEIVVPTGGATTFQADVGIDDEVLPRGSAVFQVWNGSTKLAETGVVRAGQTARRITADVTGASEVRLVVTDGGDGNSGDHADWGQPVLVTPARTATGSEGRATTDREGSRPVTTPVVTAPTTAPSPVPAPTTPAPSTPAPTTPAAAPVVRPVSGLAYRVVRNGWGPVEKDRSNGEIKSGDGRGLNVAGRGFAHGLGVHASSEVVLPTAGATRFTAQVGIDSEVGRSGSVVFQVWHGSRKLADSGVVRGGDAARTLTADVTGAGEVRLVVTDAGDGTAGDHADWALATLG